MALNLYALPMVLGDQYIVSAIVKETKDTVVFSGIQKDMRREVLVESLRPEAMRDPERRQLFLETARLQSKYSPKEIAATLELIFAEDTWHLAKEKIKGEPLDVMISSGRKLPAVTICSLFIQLCHGCIYLDTWNVNTTPLTLESIYLMDYAFRFDNIICPGERTKEATGYFLASAARQVLPLLDMKSLHAPRLREVLKRIRYGKNWEVFTTLMLDEELVRIQADIVESEKRASDAHRGRMSSVEARFAE